MTFAHVQRPLKKVDFASTELKPIDIRAHYDFLLPLEHGQRIVLFNRHLECDDFEKCFTQMSCFDRHGRLLGTVNIEHHVERENVVQCSPNEFVVCHYSYSPELSVYNSELKRSRNVGCKNFSHTCCNSKFVFGLWNTSERSASFDRYSRYHEPDSNDDDDDEDEQTGEKHSREDTSVPPGHAERSVRLASAREVHDGADNVGRASCRGDESFERGP